MKVTKMISRKMAGGILLGFLAVAGIVTGSQGSVTVYAAEELQGSGTAEDPYVITGSEDLWKFAEIVKASSDRNECAKVADGVTEIDTTVRGVVENKQTEEYDIRSLHIEKESHLCTFNGKELSLTPIEFSI